MRFVIIREIRDYLSLKNDEAPADHKGLFIKNMIISFAENYDSMMTLYFKRVSLILTSMYLCQQAKGCT